MITYTHILNYLIIQKFQKMQESSFPRCLELFDILSSVMIFENLNHLHYVNKMLKIGNNFKAYQIDYIDMRTS